MFINTIVREFFTAQSHNTTVFLIRAMSALSWCQIFFLQEGVSSVSKIKFEIWKYNLNSDGKSIRFSDFTLFQIETQLQIYKVNSFKLDIVLNKESK